MSGDMLEITGRLAGEYAAASEPVWEMGRRTVAELLDGGYASVFERFSPEMAKVAPLHALRALMEKTLREAPVGARLDEGVLVGAPDNRAYKTDHAWGEKRLTFALHLEADGRIGGFVVDPRKPLEPDPAAERRTQAACRLPFRDTWFCFWGGRTERQNYHVVSPDQRHAYDFVIWREGGTYRGTGARNEEYWCWEQEVLAPAAGTVIEAEDGVEDGVPRVQPGFFQSLRNVFRPGGNSVVLDFGEGEFCHIAHFRRGSVRVKAGERVEAGQVLGLCGNSGNSSEPHIHIHLQNASTEWNQVGYPLPFRGYAADGAPVEEGEPLQGQFLSPRE